jgi:ureidoglycolate lyase
MRALHPRPLTAEAFAPYGEVIEVRDDPREINYGHTQRFHALAQLDLMAEGGKSIASIFRSTPPAYPFAVKVMERHPKSSQAFVPLQQRPFLVVVAPAGDFDPNTVEAFIAAPTQGVNYRKGTWHHFNLALGETSDFLVIDRDADDNNTDEVELNPPLILHAPEVR